MEYDVTDLLAGDAIECKECEEITECSFGSTKYSMRLMVLAKAIERNLWRLGRKLTVSCQKGFIQVLTPTEAIEYNNKIYDSGKRKMRLAHRRSIAIDTSTLADDVRREHNDNLAKQSRQLQSLRLRVLEVEPVKKITPSRRPTPLTP